MARLEDFLDQETLNKLRGIPNSSPVDQFSSPQQPQVSELPPNPPLPERPMPLPVATPEPSPSATPTPGPTPIPTPPPVQGMGPLANPKDYKPSIAPSPEPQLPEEVEEESDPSEVAQLFTKGSDLNSNPQEQMLQQSLNNDQGFTNNTVEGLKEAQAEANRRKNMADMAQAAAMITSGGLGLAKGTKAPDISMQTAFNEGQKKRADEGVTDFQARGEKEKDDPESATSANAREMARAMLQQAGLNIKIPDNLSAAALEKRFPQLQHMATAKENAKLRADVLKDRAADRALVGEARSSEKIDKRASDLNNKLVEEVASSRSSFGKAANVKRSAEAIDTLIEQIPDKNNIDKRQIYELARSLDAMLSSGSSTIAGSEHLIPKTASGSLADIQEYISAIPTGAKQGAFVKRMQETVRREKELASKQIGATKDKLLAGFQDVKDKAPERYNAILKAHGLDEESKAKAREAAEPKISMSPSLAKDIKEQAPTNSNEEKRKMKDGRTAIFDRSTKNFIRYE